ncbi:MAG: vitamin B12-dependent ribonucleotide reductase, partial [Phycisphaeraceae bacterium]|nr:vitamin B12-dependent ribonucleotide reductase [Phycisphaeraceae bacterium]
NRIEDDEPEDEENVEAGRDEVAEEVARAAEKVAEAAEDDETAQEPVEKIVERVVERPLRRRLPNTRRSLTHKFNVAGHEGYLTVGLYEDGSPGELFITMAKEGSTIGGLMDSLGTAISVSLQYGVPVESLVNKFTHQRFEPAGMTHNPDIPFAKSLVDYIFRWMGMEFVEGYRAANAPRRGNNSDRKSEKASSRGSEGDRTASRPAAAKSTGGNGHGPAAAGTEEGEGGTSTLTTAMTSMQTDAPACDVCGTITVRNGTCYKCLNCGNSMGCS